MTDPGVADPGLAPVAAGFLPRLVAWSLDGALVAMATWLLTWHALAIGMATLQDAWKSLQQKMMARIGDGLLQAADPAALAAQLLHDPQLQAAASAAQTALYALLMPPLLVSAVLAAVYWIGCEASRWQATLGKRALALQVTDLQGRRVTFARAAARHVGGALSWLTLNLGHALAAVPPHKRALHDHLAGTRVLHADGEQRLPLWAKVWVGLLLVAGFVLPLWLLLRDATALLSAGL